MKNQRATKSRSAVSTRRAAAELDTDARAETARSEPESRARLDRLFAGVCGESANYVRASEVRRILRRSGLRDDDVRLAGVSRRLARLEADRDHDPQLDRDAFEGVLQGSVPLVERVVAQQLVVPEFEGFTQTVTEIFEATQSESGGEVASYIPQLARVPAQKYGLGVCTVDGQRLTLGDASEPVCVQSTCKPINYCLASADAGSDDVHHHIGCEPSGRSFNELSLNHRGRPHNPMINAGAILACSLIGRSLDPADRFERVLDLWTRLSGGVRPGFGNAVYLSERRTADRNFALGYFMRENGAFPEGTDLRDTLEFYFQCCSIEMTVDAFSVVAATLANGGVCPLTEERVLDADAVRKCLTLMSSCGMYDFSGEWAFTVGLPAKSGVSGLIVVVIPNTMGLCIWSPPLDRHGNSVRGVQFCRQLVQRYNVHQFDSLAGGMAGKADPRAEAAGSELLSQLLWAASKDDVHGIRRALVRGQPLGAADYDGRTALHLAASEGRLEAIRYLVSQHVPLEPRDRWGGRPIDDAQREGHDAAVAALELAMQRSASAARAG